MSNPVNSLVKSPVLNIEGLIQRESSLINSTWEGLEKLSKVVEDIAKKLYSPIIDKKEETEGMVIQDFETLDESLSIKSLIPDLLVTISKGIDALAASQIKISRILAILEAIQRLFPTS